MSARARSLAYALLLAAGAVAHGASDDKVAYKWVDENGVVHYGDSIPAKYAKQENSVLNKQGVEVGRNEAQKTAEQIEREAREREIELRRKQHDAFLLTTYTSVKDIESLRDERLGQISGQRRAAEQYIEGLHSRLSTLQTRAFTFKPYNESAGARRMPDDLAEELVRTVSEMRSQRNALLAKDVEENTLRAQFQSDIERYRELRTVRSGR